MPRLPAGVWSLSGFSVVWFGGIVVPLIAIILVSFLQGRGIRINVDPTFLQYEKFFSYGGNELLVRSVRIAGTITFIELLIAFPFALLAMLVVASRFDTRLMEAAEDLGATRWQRFWPVEVPILKPGIFAASFFGFCFRLMNSRLASLCEPDRILYHFIFGFSLELTTQRYRSYMP